MKNRERVMSIIRGEKPDKIPFIARMDIWYSFHKNHGSLPEEYFNWDLCDIERDLRVGNPARTKSLFRTKLMKVEVREEFKQGRNIKQITTPFGTVREVFAVNDDAMRKGIPFAKCRIEHFVKNKKDYDVMSYITENTIFEPTYEEFLRFQDAVGEDGLPLTITGCDPMFTIMHDFIGYNSCYFELNDNISQIEDLYQVMCQKTDDLIKILVQSPAILIRHGAHYDSQMTPPPIFDKYILPYLKNVAGRLHKVDKLLAIHADADSSRLLQSFLDSNIDMVESFCTSPMVKVTLKEAIDAWGKKIIIWGGIPSTLLVPAVVPDHRFNDYIKEICEVLTKNDCRVILGVSDNVMPETDIGRLKVIAEMVESLKH